MGERTLNFGVDATDADYQIRDSDPAGGDLIIEHTPTGATFEYDATENAWVPTDPIGSTNRRAPGVVADSVDAQSVSNIPIVGPSGFDTLSAALTTVSAGEMILITKDIAENGTVIDKPVRVSGLNAALRENNTGTEIDVSGGDGLILDSQGIHLEHLYISGGGSSNFGIQVGNGSTHNAITMQNLEVRTHGGDGIVVNGDNQGHEWRNIITNANSGDGLNIDLSSGGYFNQNEVHLRSWSNGGDAVYTDATGGEITGNDWVWYAENNTGWGWFHNGGDFERNRIVGYGAEANSGGALHVTDIGTDWEPNVLDVGNLGQTVDTSEEFWYTFRGRTGGLNHDFIGSREGAHNAWYCRDDFGDGKYENRDGQAEFRYTGSEYGNVGAYRPRWNERLAGVSVSNNQLNLASTSAATMLNTIEYGEWEWEFTFSTAPSSDFVFFRFLQGGSAEYEVVLFANGTIELNYRAGPKTKIVSGSWTPDTNTHTLRATRDSTDTWELFFDGSSQGTGTESTAVTPETFDIENATDEAVDIGYVELR